jgi:hypothetical protein
MAYPKKTIYLAGPMSGIPEFNFPRFNVVTAFMRSSGHTVFNPAEKDIEVHGPDIETSPTGDINDAKAKGFSLRDALAADTDFICKKANAIVMLPGWEKSTGAQAEHRLAVALLNDGMEITYLSEEMCKFMEMANAR